MSAHMSQDWLGNGGRIDPGPPSGLHAEEPVAELQIYLPEPQHAPLVSYQNSNIL